MQVVRAEFADFARGILEHHREILIELKGDADGA